MDKTELYNKLVCALTHDIRVCGVCKKCGIYESEVRMDLVRELAKYMGMNLPWVEEEH